VAASSGTGAQARLERVTNCGRNMQFAAQMLADLQAQLKKLPQ